MMARGLDQRGLFASGDTRVVAAPFGPDVFPTERRSRYETRVYANLCPFSAVDTMVSADKLQKVEKGFKTKGFHDSRAWNIALWTRSKGNSEPRAGDRSEGMPREVDGDGRERRAAALNSRRGGRGRCGWSGPCRPGIGGSVTFATALASSPIGRPVHAVQNAGRKAGARRSSASVLCAEVIDLESVFSQSSPGGWGGRRGLRAVTGERDEQYQVTVRKRPLGWMVSDSEVDPCHPGSLPAQPLHSCSAVDRFDSSSPHGIAVRGNQEKTR